MRIKHGLYSQRVEHFQPRKQGQLSGSHLRTHSPNSVVGGVLTQHNQGTKRMSPLLLTYTQIPVHTSVCTAHTYTWAQWEKVRKAQRPNLHYLWHRHSPHLWSLHILEASTQPALLWSLWSELSFISTSQASCFAVLLLFHETLKRPTLPSLKSTLNKFSVTC